MVIDMLMDGSSTMVLLEEKFGTVAIGVVWFEEIMDKEGNDGVVVIGRTDATDVLEVTTGGVDADKFAVSAPDVEATEAVALELDVIDKFVLVVSAVGVDTSEIVKLYVSKLKVSVIGVDGKVEIDVDTPSVED